MIISMADGVNEMNAYRLHGDVVRGEGEECTAEDAGSQQKTG